MKAMKTLGEIRKHLRTNSGEFHELTGQERPSVRTMTCDGVDSGGMEPVGSELTRERPDLWLSALGRMDALAGYQCPSKLPLDDGTIYACCYRPSTPYVPPPPPKPPSPEELERKERERAQREIADLEELLRRKLEELDQFIREKKEEIGRREEEIGAIRERIRQARKKLPAIKCAPVVCVPEGAMEWLLHEAGHWVAATHEERALPNYGLADEIVATSGGFQQIACPTSGLIYEREWQAWAFEEIVLAPFGHARELAPPTQRDGVAFSKVGPVPAWALRHVEHQIRALRVDLESWRVVWGEWVRWGMAKTKEQRPWEKAE